MSGLVTIIQPMGFALGAVATTVALASCRNPMRVFAPRMRPVPVRIDGKHQRTRR
jgi:hypothetical protein